MSRQSDARPIRSAAVVGAMLSAWALAAPVRAQEVARAEPAIACARLDPETARTPAEIAALRDCFEARKFELEVSDLKEKAANALSQNLLGPALGVLAALLTLAGSLAGARLSAHASFTELYDKRAADRQQHNAKLVETLHDETSPLRLTSAATMVARLATLRTSRGRSAAGKVAAEEFSYLSTIAFAALRDDTLPPLIAKYLADNLVGALGLTQRRLFAPRRSRMSGYDLQNVRIENAWWAGIDGRDADFFGAHLPKTSFRRADLRKAVFYDADLTKVVMIGADLRGANFRNATLHGANLSGADLRGAEHLDTAKLDDHTKWDARTKWPKGFTPPIRA